jgi:hypothetical protein
MTTREREEMLAYLFGGFAGPTASCRAWMLAEPRFATFLERHREKIRKKARGVANAAGLDDLLAELEAAYHLLRERRFELSYEAYAAAKTRGPDFTVTYKTHIRFNVEVKRLRPAVPPAVPLSTPPAFEPRLLDAVCDKLVQLPPSTMNLLLLVASDAPEHTDLAEALRSLVARAERADAALFARHGYATPRDFFAGFRRVSAVLLRRTGPPGSAEPAAFPPPTALWPNPQARHPLPADLRTLLAR